MPMVVALASGRYLDADAQRRLARHVHGGGRLLLLGRIPTHDLEARPCTVLADALGIEAGRLIQGSHRYFTSVVARGFAGPSPETRVGWLQEIAASHGETLLVDVATGRSCGVAVEHGAGRAIVLAAELPSDPRLFAACAAHLGVTPGLSHSTGSSAGLFTTSTIDETGGRLVHLLNVSGHACATTLSLAGEPLFGGRELVMPARTGRMLPVGLRLPAAKIRWSTAEIAGTGTDRLSVAVLQDEEVVSLETDRDVRAEQPCHISRDGHVVTITALRQTCGLRLDLTLT